MFYEVALIELTALQGAAGKFTERPACGEAPHTVLFHSSNCLLVAKLEMCLMALFTSGLGGLRV